MTATLKLQLALIITTTFLLGAAVGLYIASQIIGDYIQ